jgi:glucan phosphoethanolaminetransferase (alkaline phosphatase superfamily)
MTLENSIRLLAGFLILLSLLLYYFVSPYWLLLTAFVGLNLLQSSITRFCPAETIFKKLFFRSKDRVGESACGC